MKLETLTKIVDTVAAAARQEERRRASPPPVTVTLGAGDLERVREIKAMRGGTTEEAVRWALHSCNVWGEE